MGSCHIAHDCKIGDRNIFANNTLLAGHVVVEVRFSLCLSTLNLDLAAWFHLVYVVNAGQYTHSRSHGGPPVLSYWLFCFHWRWFCGIFSLNTSQMPNISNGYSLVRLYIGFTRCSKVHDGDWRKSRTSRFESGGT